MRYCSACAHEVAAFAPGPGGRRPEAACPRCGSLERDRFLALLLDGLAPWLAGARLVIEVAPSRQTSRQLRRLAGPAHLRMDLDPSADRRTVDVQASVTDLPFADASVDLVVCYHVLEHVPDDRKAMGELARVLRPGGLALVQVPWRASRTTDEDPSAPEDERIRRFGQADHVRYYGGDFEDRLAGAGLDYARFTPGTLVGVETCAVLGLLPGEDVWAVSRARGASGRALAVDGLSGSSMGDVVRRLSRGPDPREVARLRAELATAQTQAQRWETAYRRLRGRAPVRLMAALTRPVRHRWHP